MGDGAIVEFASVVDAVVCAVAIQKAVAEHQAGTPADRRIVFRIGINLGDVVVEGDDLLGDGVNVAARLEQLCEPGGVLVSGTAYDQLQGKLGLPLEFTGEQRVKNIERPVRAYRVRLDGTAARPAAGSRRRDRGRHRGRRHGAARRPGMAALARALAAPAALRSPSCRLRTGLATRGSAGSRTAWSRTSSATYRVGWDVMAAARRSPTATHRATRAGSARSSASATSSRAAWRATATAAGQCGLVDAASGRQVWSERYDRPLEDLFAVQDELALRIATSLGGAVAATRRGSALRKRPGNLQIVRSLPARRRGAGQGARRRTLRRSSCSSG